MVEQFDAALLPGVQIVTLTIGVFLLPYGADEIVMGTVFVALLDVGVADASVARVDVLVVELVVVLLEVVLLVVVVPLVPELDVLELLDVVESEPPPPPHAARAIVNAAARTPKIARIVFFRLLDVVGTEPLRECLRQVCTPGVRPHVSACLDDEPGLLNHEWTVASAHRHARRG